MGSKKKHAQLAAAQKSFRRYMLFAVPLVVFFVAIEPGRNVFRQLRLAVLPALVLLVFFEYLRTKTGDSLPSPDDPLRLNHQQDDETL